MNAEIITIGDEILIGQIVDSNASFIGKELTRIGVEVVKIQSIKDEQQQILKTLNQVEEQTEIIILTGGLGPTRDDITKKTLTDFFKDKLIENSAVLNQVRETFSKLNRPLLKENIDQALLPSKAEALYNKWGTAPGMWFEENGKIYISMPGVPVEMKNLMKVEVLPRLKQKFKLPFILQKTILTYGLGESFLADKIKDLEESLPENMSLAYLASPGRVRLRIMARGKNEIALAEKIDTWIIELKNRIKEHFGGIEEEYSLETEIANLLTSKKKSIAVAESCTGGRIASLLTKAPGASAFFKGGIIPYETKMKVNILGVDQEIIDKHSVVSTETAQAMAAETRKLFQTDFAISTTGNAGPTKGDSNAEIGTVYIGVADAEKTEAFEFNFGKVREKVVIRAVIKSLEILKQKISV